MNIVRSLVHIPILSAVAIIRGDPNGFFSKTKAFIWVEGLTVILSEAVISVSLLDLATDFFSPTDSNCLAHIAFSFA